MFHNSRSSLSPISSTGQFVDCPASATMVHNVGHHARLMRLEVKFLQDQLAEHGERLLMAGADLVLPHVLLDQVSIVTRFIKSQLFPLTPYKGFFLTEYVYPLLCQISLFLTTLGQVSGAITKTEELTRELTNLRRELRRHKATVRTERVNSVTISNGSVSMLGVITAGLLVGYLLYKVKK